MCSTKGQAHLLQPSAGPSVELVGILGLLVKEETLVPKKAWRYHFRVRREMLRDE